MIHISIIIGGGTADDMAVSIYSHHLKQSMDQPGKVTKPARGQLKRENEMHPW